tara:strand:+ start:19 stop:669 length:651 start_codon:yes stop_codon:yes gene_type:complete
MDRIAQTAYPVIKGVYEDSNSNYENIVVPFTDGTKVMQVVTNLEEAYNTEGRSLINSFEKNVTLAIIDEAWKVHLREMDDLKQSVQNAVYEQKDPLLIYKFESFNLFKSMLEKLNMDITSFLYKANLPIRDPKEVRQAKPPQRSVSGLTASRTQMSQGASNPNVPRQVQQSKAQPVRTEKKIGRNELVTIRKGEQEKILKYKKAQNLIAEGWEIIK